MLTVIIPSLNSESTLVPVFSALVPASAEGVVKEVIVVDAGSNDKTAEIADACGALWLEHSGTVGERVSFAVSHATRGEWLMFLSPAAVLDASWTGEFTAFTDRLARIGRLNKMAATFSYRSEDFGWKPRLRERSLSLSTQLFAKPSDMQGLLLSKALYDAHGGHDHSARSGVVSLKRPLKRSELKQLASCATDFSAIA
ncbi:glycosyltransferase [Rhodobacteraceae bacterium RKSG542]|uniref:glycosyltransferase n=1 Tax=Pseudovibrio flavus TaxID=2529854 RepID=UPI0012BC3A56|nr:glycosyltransferase [Pseudovibrio flavus]MTI18687.1 glycosyltransferase [Pseudovibrio flavus]